jgi:NAD(P)-dependent dehydrogenase (short-subunit alcohol dehydrogenase family)
LTINAKRVALITGYGSGIGLGIAKALADSEFDLVLDVARDTSSDTDAASIWTREVKLVHVPGDATSAAGRRAILDGVRKHFGRLDVLVNIVDVASSIAGNLMHLSEESFQQLIASGLKGPYFFTQLAARWMADQKKADATFRGVVINISPTIAPKITSNRPAMATQLWAHRLAEFGIAVYEVRPGLIRSETSPLTSEEYYHWIAGGKVVENRWGQPEDVGRAVAMLARGDLSYATGNILNIDGGLSLRRL